MDSNCSFCYTGPIQSCAHMCVYIEYFTFVWISIYHIYSYVYVYISLYRFKMFQCTFHPSSLATLHVVGSMGHQITAKPGISEIRRIKHCPTRLTSPLEVIMKSLDQTRTDTPCVPPANGRPCRAIASSQCSHRAASHCHSVLTTPPGVRHWQPSEDRLRGISMKTAIGTRQIRLLSGANVPVVQ